MGMSTIHLSTLHFQYPQTLHPLFENIDLTFATGWTAILGANGAGKSTLLQLACGLLKPEFGSVSAPEHTAYVEQRTDDPPRNCETFACAYDREACRLHGLLEIERDWFYRWETLSHGERKRLQIACALYEEPDALAVDEPTNHLDAQAIALIGDALYGFKGIGLLVSHDRALSDQLCNSSVIVHAPYVRMLHCKPSQALDESSKVSEASIRSLQNGQQKLKRLSSESTRRKQLASVQDSKNSKRNIAPKDHDAKAKIDGARVSGVDGRAGRLKSQLDRRVTHMHESLQDIRDGLDESRKLDLQSPLAGITIISESLKRDTVVRITPGSLPLGPDRTLSYGPLEIPPDGRIAFTGANGSGKTTLMQHVHALIVSEGIPVAYVPQEQDKRACEKALEDLERLDPATKGRVISTLTRLGSDPQLIRSSVLASPGEAKKLLLSLLFEKSVSVLLLDEPTNHLDLPARLVLEKALGAYKGALLCISHDTAFLEAVCTTRWHIEPDPGNQGIGMLQKLPWAYDYSYP
ncbi:MAG: ATP-binding cassette domain-containing protein [Sphaerochaeta sp.]